MFFWGKNVCGRDMSRSVCCAKWCRRHYLTQQRTKKSALFNATPGIWVQIWSDSNHVQMTDMYLAHRHSAENHASVSLSKTRTGRKRGSRRMENQDDRHRWSVIVLQNATVNVAVDLARVFDKERAQELFLIHENGCCWGPHGFSPARHETFETWKGSGAGENWDSVSNMSQTCCEVCTVDGRTSEKKRHYLTQQKTTKKYRGWLDWWIKTALFNATVAKTALFNATAPISATPCM